MRLFTGFWPPERVADDLSAAVRALPPATWSEATAGLAKFRLVPRERWHVTLRFHGDDADPENLGADLDSELADGRPCGPRLRFARSGVFRGVLWVGVQPAEETDADALRTLARLAGADPRAYRAHLTIARWRSGRADARLLGRLLQDYVGPWWPVDEIALISSEQRSGSRAYRAVHRVPLAPPASGAADVSGSA